MGASPSGVRIPPSPPEVRQIAQRIQCERLRWLRVALPLVLPADLGVRSVSEAAVHFSLGRQAALATYSIAGAVVRTPADIENYHFRKFVREDWV